MSEFDSSESLEAPKIKGVRKSNQPKVDFEAGANGPSQPEFDLSFLDCEFSKEEEPVVPKKRGRPKKVLEVVDEEDDEEPVAPKPKRKQTEAQKQNFIKALEKRRENVALRKAAKELEKQVKEAELETKKKEVERKIVKKAVCIKKKEILSQAALDDISDEDMSELIREIMCNLTGCGCQQCQNGDNSDEEGEEGDVGDIDTFCIFIYSFFLFIFCLI
jgi:hypothetical protein